MHIEMVMKKPGVELPVLKPGGIRYVVAENGVFLERSTSLFTTSCRVDDWAAGLEPHAEECVLRCPAIPRPMLASMLGFFRWAYKLHGGEAALVLLYNRTERRFDWSCPLQTVRVWESWDGRWHASSEITYTDPTAVPPGYVVYGDAHSHGHLPAYASNVDKADETYKDGLHIIAGYVDWGKPNFHIDFVMDGQRFALTAKDVFESLDVEPSTQVPRQWKKQVRILRDPYRYRKSKRHDSGWWSSGYDSTSGATDDKDDRRETEWKAHDYKDDSKNNTR